MAVDDIADLDDLVIDDGEVASRELHDALHRHRRARWSRRRGESGGLSAERGLDELERIAEQKRTIRSGLDRKREGRRRETGLRLLQGGRQDAFHDPPRFLGRLDRGQAELCANVFGPGPVAGPRPTGALEHDLLEDPALALDSRRKVEEVAKRHSHVDAMRRLAVARRGLLLERTDRHDLRLPTPGHVGEATQDVGRGRPVRGPSDVLEEVGVRDQLGLDAPPMNLELARQTRALRVGGGAQPPE